MNYGVGDTVVCTDSTNLNNADNGLKRGATYAVNAIELQCCNTLMVSVDVSRHCNRTLCYKCLSSFDGHWFAPWRFIKLDGVKQEHEEEATA